MASDKDQTPVGMIDLASAFPTPPTQGVNHFALAVTANEVLLTIGISRASMQQESPSSPPTPVIAIEWLMSLSTSPQSAKLLLNSLSQALAEYEKQFGAIPQDPRALINVSGGGLAPVKD